MRRLLEWLHTDFFTSFLLGLALMMKLNMLLLVMAAIMLMVSGQLSDAEAITSVATEEWELFKMEYNKSYESIVEEQFRMKIFMENKLSVIKHNQLYAQNLTTFKMATNHLSDMLNQEVASTLNGYEGESEDDAGLGSTYIPPDGDVTLPSTVDWRQKGIVTPVKNQRACGSCWAFSATGSLEGQHARKTGHLVSLSEQDLVDCCHLCHGCHGGLMNLAFKCIMNDKGIDSEGYYPYKAQDGTCKYSYKFSAANDTGFMRITRGDETALKKAVALVGPISVAIDASRTFMHYKSGIYYDPDCSPTHLDHGVLLVGYGREKGMDYWLVKNSWSTHWGDDGYIKMARNQDNMCGIATAASFPLV